MIVCYLEGNFRSYILKFLRMFYSNVDFNVDFISQAQSESRSFYLYKLYKKQKNILLNATESALIFLNYVHPVVFQRVRALFHQNMPDRTL